MKTMLRCDERVVGLCFMRLPSKLVQATSSIGSMRAIDIAIGSHAAGTDSAVHRSPMAPSTIARGQGRWPLIVSACRMLSSKPITSSQQLGHILEAGDEARRHIDAGGEDDSEMREHGHVRGVRRIGRPSARRASPPRISTPDRHRASASTTR